VEYQVAMPYIGGILSKNSYKRLNRSTQPFAKRWMKELADSTKSLDVPEADSYSIQVHGLFTDERRPDIHNLHEIIADSLQRGLGKNDKYFVFEPDTYELGFVDPCLIISIKGVRK